ncbi:hypothetical protein [Brevundimonas diminuta]|uniref:hypothetical protein n=1 Tax=Brevundimonas diminuta TaxID=293 RepID=UPI001F584BAE|nr:hypothetical protein [Brevundimonas diminuta]
MDPNNNQPNPDPTLVLILGRIEGQLGTYIDLMKSMQTKHDSLEDRVRKVENSKSWLLGAAAVLGGVVSFLMKVFLP